MVQDNLLIWKFKRGNKEALRRIYEKYKNDMLKLAVVLVNDVNLAEDLVHDVFVNFAQSAAKVRPSGNLKGFLATCLVNRVRNLKRDQQRHETATLDRPDSIISAAARPEQWAILSEQLQLLSGAMAQLPVEQREVIALYMQGDMTFRQIAGLQDVSINTIQGRYRYGLNKLRTLLNNEVTK